MKTFQILLALLSFTIHLKAATFTVHNNTTNTYAANTLRVQSVGSGPSFMGINSTSLAPGGTASVNAGTYWNSYDCYGYNSVQGQRMYPTNDIPDGAAGGEWWILPPDADTNCTFTLCVQNKDIVPHVYSVYKNGVAYAPPGGGAITLGLNGGAFGCVSWQNSCSDSNGWSLMFAQVELEYYPQIPPITNMAIASGGAGGAPPPAYPPSTNGALPSLGFSNAPPTNVVWNPSQQTNAILSQQGGGPSNN